MADDEIKLDGTITLAMAEAGGRAVVVCLEDSEFMRKSNRAGEMAARVYRAMQRAADQES